MSSNQFQRPHAPIAQPSKSKTPIWLFVIIGFCAVSTLACCGGGFLLVKYGMQVVAADIELQLRDHPKIREQIGEIESLTCNFSKTAAMNDDETIVYDIVGSNSNGELTIYSTSDWDEGEIISAAELRMENGDFFELDLRELNSNQ